MPHPSARNFLHWLQNRQFDIQCWESQLEEGRAPKFKSAVNRDLYLRIAEAKLEFGSL